MNCLSYHRNYNVLEQKKIMQEVTVISGKLEKYKYIFGQVLLTLFSLKVTISMGNFSYSKLKNNLYYHYKKRTAHTMHSTVVR